MKKILICIVMISCFFVAGICFAKADAQSVESPPIKVITHNMVPGEVDIERVLKSYLIPQKNCPIYLYPENNSEIVDYVHSGEVLNVISTEIHSIPENGKTNITGNPKNFWGKSFRIINVGKLIPEKDDKIYLLFYGGEGTYLAWYRNNIIRVSADGIRNCPNKKVSEEQQWAEYKGNKKLNDELWICIKKVSGVEGWVKFESTKDWVRNGSTGMFLNENFVIQSIKSRYQ